MGYIQVLTNEGVNLWDVAEFLLLYEESRDGKQDAEWEKRWQKLHTRGGTGYVNVIYKNHLESKLTSDLLLQHLVKEEKK